METDTERAASLSPALTSFVEASRVLTGTSEGIRSLKPLTQVVTSLSLLPRETPPMFVAHEGEGGGGSLLAPTAQNPTTL